MLETAVLQSLTEIEVLQIYKDDISLDWKTFTGAILLIPSKNFKKLIVKTKLFS